MPARFAVLLLFLMLLPVLTLGRADASLAVDTGTESITSEHIDQVWSGSPITFALHATAQYITVAYYDRNRQLTLAQRSVTGKRWAYRKLDIKTDWDSHKYITMTSDAKGRLHVAANMHVTPLIYFMSDIDGSISSLKRVPYLVEGAPENYMTYPSFMRTPGNDLIFKYRDGRSGDGNEIYDVFDSVSATWTPLLNTPLLDGAGRYSAYGVGPVLGPDKRFHLVWVWRDHNVETNHDLSYARSVDLLHWENAQGKSLQLPLTLEQATILDPVPTHGGIINGNTQLGFDDQGRVMIVYHKFDPAGNTQVYLARLEGGEWHIVQITHWKNYRWDFSGGGTINFEVKLKSPTVAENGDISVEVEKKGNTADYRLHAIDLKPSGQFSVQDPYASAMPSIAVHEGMILNRVVSPVSQGKRYIIAWTTKPAHRDLPLAQSPPPTDLTLITIETGKKVP